MLNKNIILKNFDLKKRLNKKFKISKILKKVLSEDNQILKSLGPSYKDSYNKKIIKKLKKNSQFRLIGMGGSILGSKAIYNFLSPKGKQFSFIDNLSNEFEEINSKKMVNVIISKSGNTLETISNSNIFISKNQSNFFITENKKSYLMNLANKLKAEIIHHNNFIGGRYSVLSEVGMLPAELMGFKPSKFRKLNLLIKNKNFFNSLVINVACMLELIYKNKKNSIILNYDQKSNDLFSWYQQLVAESLGKKSKGILPIVSNMPKDNHSLMQYYLEGAKNHFFTFFFVKEKVKKKK